ncbi:MAG: glycosyltransferase family 39 protein [Chloroflexota bacterium]
MTAIIDEPRDSVQRVVRPVTLAAVFVAVFAMALLPRLMARDQFITSDEDQWMSRSGGFAYALSTGELRRTYQNGHPGVTTMWLGVLSMGRDRAYEFADRVHRQRLVAVVPGFWDALIQARVGPIVVTALTVATIGLLVARIWGGPAGFLAGAISALDPWVIGLQQLLHTDGLLTGFMGVSALASIVYWWQGGARPYLVLGGIAAGLALLSKTPALFLGPFTLAVALIAWRSGRVSNGQVLAGLVTFGVCTGVSFVALWPALWVAPVEMLGRMLEFLKDTGGEADEVGSFFFGQSLGDPGPLYYPVALAFRLSLGLLLGLVGLIACWRSVGGKGAIGLVALYVVGFTVMMIASPKKFDRYLLPIEPMLAILAALGAIAGARRLLTWRPAIPASVAVISLQLLTIGLVYPYYLAYYNPLLGGGAVAARSVMVGNGEGLDLAADWLNAQPRATESWVAAHSFDILQGMYVGSGEPLRERAPSQADYILLYGRRIQMRRWGPSLDAYLASRQTLHTVTLNGIDYVQIYAGPKFDAPGGTP